MLSQMEFVLVMELINESYVVMKDVQVKLWQEGYVTGMALRERFAILKDVPIESSIQEFVFVMGQRKGLAVIKDAIIGLLI